MAALDEHASRSDVVVIAAVENRNGRWRRTVTFTLAAARNRYRRAVANGLRAVLFTAELRVTHHHDGTLSDLSAASSEALAALDEYVLRSDVVVLCAVENARGGVRRTAWFTLDAARRRKFRAEALGHPARLVTAQLRVTHQHAATLDALAALDAEGVAA